MWKEEGHRQYRSVPQITAHVAMILATKLFSSGVIKCWFRDTMAMVTSQMPAASFFNIVLIVLMSLDGTGDVNSLLEAILSGFFSVFGCI